MNDVRALIFDVFGTLVDWRTSVAREARSVLLRRVAASTARPLPTPGAPSTSR